MNRRAKAAAHTVDPPTSSRPDQASPPSGPRTATRPNPANSEEADLAAAARPPSLRRSSRQPAAPSTAATPEPPSSDPAAEALDQVDRHPSEARPAAARTSVDKGHLVPKPGATNRGSGKRPSARLSAPLKHASPPLQPKKRRQADDLVVEMDKDKVDSAPSNVPRQPSGSRDATAATTVVEAQEAGEQARLRDDTEWALDGLKPGAAPGTQRDSLATIAEICASRRGRLALRSTGLADDVLTATAKLAFHGDSALALGAATVILAFCQADADPRLLGRLDVAQLACKLLQFPGALAPGSSLATRFLRPLQEAPYSRQLPREASFSPQSVVLTALSGVLDPHNTSVNIDPLKHALRRAGLLPVAAQLAAEKERALVDLSPTMHTVQALWQMHRALVLLENSCFACSENEAHLVEIEITRGVAPLVARMGIAQWLVQQIQALSSQPLVLGLKKDCLRVLLAVLMNMTQNNAVGRGKVVAARATEAVPPLIAKIMQSGQGAAGRALSSAELTLWVDELSSCLGLLINLVEHDTELRGRMRGMRLPASAPGAEAEGVVALLSTLMAVAASQPNAGGGDGAAQQDGGSAGRRRSSLGADEVTLDSLQHGEGEGAASIVEVYAAILLGFLIEGDRGAQAEAALLLPGKTIAPVAAAVARCLQFYVSAGAITKSTEDSLRALLASLKQQIAQTA